MLLCIACSVIGAFVGAWWYETFGPPYGQLGYEFEGLQEIAAGASIGGFAGAFWGWIALGPGRQGPLALALVGLGGIAAGALVMTGLVYVGAWTNSDGPDRAAVIGIFGIPGGLALAFMIARAARHKTR